MGASTGQRVRGQLVPGIVISKGYDGPRYSMIGLLKGISVMVKTTQTVKQRTRDTSRRFLETLVDRLEVVRPLDRLI